MAGAHAGLIIRGVSVGIEMDHAHPTRRDGLGDRADDGPRDGVIATQDHGHGAAGHDVEHPVERDSMTALRPRGHDVGITRIDDIEHPEWLDAKRQGVAAAGRGRLADGPRPETGAGAVADPVIERDAQDGHIGRTPAQRRRVGDDRPAAVRDRRSPGLRSGRRMDSPDPSHWHGHSRAGIGRRMGTLTRPSRGASPVFAGIQRDAPSRMLRHLPGG